MTETTSVLEEQAMSLLESGQVKQARAVYTELCSLNPDDPDIWFMAAAISGDLGLTDEAIDFLNRALKLDADFPEAHMAMALLLKGESRFPEALDEIERVLAIQKDSGEAWVIKSGIEGIAGHFSAAIGSARQAVRLIPESLEARVNLGNGLAALGNDADSVKEFQIVVSQDPQYIPAYTSLIESLVNLGRIDEADECCTRAESQSQPGDVTLLRARANILQHQGENDRAYKLLRPLISSNNIEARAAVTFARACMVLGLPEEAIPVIENILTDTESLAPKIHWSLLMALGRLLDNVKKYDEAFDCFERGHRLHHVEFDPAGHRQYIEQFKYYFSQQALARLPRSSNQSTKPIFIVGMPRSGTTLVEQIISSHPDVYGAGELSLIGEIAEKLPLSSGRVADYPADIIGLTQQITDDAAADYLSAIEKLSGGNSLRVIDKLPGNFMHLGLISLLFPGARIIHCKRDPLDTCLSCYTQNFSGHDYIHDLSHLGGFYREYLSLMSHWKTVLPMPVLEVQYEHIIANTEEESGRLIEFCGLPWSDACLQFYENKRYAFTASFDQVRKPIYKTSTERWRHYEKHLSPLIQALGDAC
ncbi:MAG: sulfotransferase [Gammaproteobacteria bacterium]